MDYTKLSDIALIQQIQRSKTDALSELYDRYSRLVYSLALNAVGDQATAEEITQEVFTQVWVNAGSYRSEKAKVVTWLASITRYRSIDVWRRRKSRPHAHSDPWDEAFDIPNGVRLEDTVEENLLRQRVRAALDQLPEDQRQALALAYFRGYTHQQIADALNTPLGTVKTRIRLAMQKLRVLFQEADLRV